MKKKSKKTFKVIEDIQPWLVVEMSTNYPSAFNRLFVVYSFINLEKDALCKERTISFELRKEAFGIRKKQIIFYSDIHAVL